MYAAGATVHRTRRPYPPPDNSKHYTEVPPRTVKQHNAIYCARKRLSTDFGVDDMQAMEKIGMLIAVLLFVLLAVGGPIYIIRYALS
ncbi:hypothetical protein GH5_04363 [Leishmania sp. Ghana 2012 LV757]|uniref:hypothetical protein n=1 Tax=Leishmania sp. Ghana 2012 LV757 TaxID=2803181 RepID=UPI001B78803C|nr:hypothetical protein GH5_04363 [Leishmania sp. Ghana 2012 LV757]